MVTGIFFDVPRCHAEINQLQVKLVPIINRDTDVVTLEIIIYKAYRMKPLKDIKKLKANLIYLKKTKSLFALKMIESLPKLCHDDSFLGVMF